MGFAKGFLRDSKPCAYPPAHRLIAATAPSLPSPNHVPYFSKLIWQSQMGACVGFAMKRTIQLGLRMAGYADSPMISADAAYKLGRSEETSSADPDNPPPLKDAGSEPGLVLLAARTVGVLLESDAPDPSTDPSLVANDVTPWSLDRVNERPGPDQLVQAYSMRDLEFHEIFGQPAGGWRNAATEVMVRRAPVMFAMFVDTGYENNRGEIVTQINEADPNGGGHAQVLLDASNPDYAVIGNQWHWPAAGQFWGTQDGNKWGLPPGCGRMAWPCFEKHCWLMHGVTSGPPALMRAA
jgi:hypothetical protein